MRSNWFDRIIYGLQLSTIVIIVTVSVHAALSMKKEAYVDINDDHNMYTQMIYNEIPNTQLGISAHKTNLIYAKSSSKAEKQMQKTHAETVKKMTELNNAGENIQDHKLAMQNKEASVKRGEKF